MKLIIQIPCYNEEECLAETIASLPKQIDGIDIIETLVIDDGSSDSTIFVAKKCGVDHILKLGINFGLGRAFSKGLSYAVYANADIIVNTDADNQYCAKDIEKIVRPILAKEAQIVVGSRPIDKHFEFTKTKKFLQKLGSKVVKNLTKLDIADAPSGFRAISSDAAKKIFISNSYSYTLEMLIQASIKNIIVKSVPIRVNPAKRPSRLVKSIPSYIIKNIFIIIDVYFRYRARKILSYISFVLLFSSSLICFRFLYYYLNGFGEGKIQSLILAVILFGAGISFIVTAFLSELISTNRRLIEYNSEKLDKLISNLNSG